MRVIHRLVNILILIGAASLIAGVGIKVFVPAGWEWLSVSPGGFLRLGDTTLLLGIALSLREIVHGKSVQP